MDGDMMMHSMQEAFILAQEGWIFWQPGGVI